MNEDELCKMAAARAYLTAARMMVEVSQNLTERALCAMPPGQSGLCEDMELRRRHWSLHDEMTDCLETIAGAIETENDKETEGRA